MARWEKLRKEWREKVNSGEAAEGYIKNDEEMRSAMWIYLGELFGGEKEWDELEKTLRDWISKKEEECKDIANPEK